MRKYSMLLGDLAIWLKEMRKIKDLRNKWKSKTKSEKNWKPVYKIETKTEIS